MDSPGPTAIEQREQHIDLPALADQVWSGQIGRVEWTGFGQRMEHFLPVERCHGLFASPFQTPMGFGSEFLVCPIRARGQASFLTRRKNEDLGGPRRRKAWRFAQRGPMWCRPEPSVLGPKDPQRMNAIAWDPGYADGNVILGFGR
jgi:hypothetical protein